jgi:hypothetical protein
MRTSSIVRAHSGAELCNSVYDVTGDAYGLVDFLTKLHSDTSLRRGKSGGINSHTRNGWKFILVVGLHVYNWNCLWICSIFSFGDRCGDDNHRIEIQKTNIYSNGHASKGFKVRRSYDYWHMACRVLQLAYATRRIELSHLTGKPVA